MSRDIRSFFQVLSKKSGSTTKDEKKPKPVVLNDSDDDIVDSTPTKVKKPSQTKKRAFVVSSDSEDESKTKKESPPKKQKTAKEEKRLRPVNLDALKKPIKQSEVKYVKQEISEKPVKEDKPKKQKSKKKNNTELAVHKDKDFEKTLEDLDDDTDDTILLDNLDVLDKTLEAVSTSEPTVTEKTNTSKKEDKNVNLDESKSNSAVQHGNKKENKNDIHDKTKTPKKGIHLNLDQFKSKSDAHHENTEENKNDTPKKAHKRARKNSESTPTSTKKKKLEQTDSGIDQDLEKWEKKRNSAGLYVAYLHRGGPKHHGEKEYPKGKPDCLKNLTFLRTGVLDSLESEEFENLVTDHGGRIVHSVSKKVSYVVVGDEPGPAKIEKAKKYQLPRISEDEFLDLILTKSGMKPKYAVKQESEDFGFESSENGSFSKSEKENGDSIENNVSVIKEQKEEVKHTNGDKNGDIDLLEKQRELDKPIIKEEASKSCDKSVKPEKSVLEDSKKEAVVENKAKSVPETKITNSNNSDGLSWTEKYKPTNLKSVIGQQDPKSNMNKLKMWLENWFKNADPERRKKLPKPNLYNQFDGAYFKAALLSGPPGVGKTTTATLVAKELGFDIIEFNASDTRNKKMLHEEISQMMQSKTVAGFVQGQKNINQKRVLLMDEVDGMAGNEDRGGIAELINFIKNANFPIICMCNNRDLPKMRSLVNHCYALKFGKPNLNQIRGAMMSICFKEGLTIKPDAVAQLITGTGCDIRQTLNHLAMWSAVEKNVSLETVQKNSKESYKDVVIGPWDVIRKVFSKMENKDMTLADKSRLFFYDYSFGPMFVQENYLTVEPECTGPKQNQSLEKLIRRHLAADCLSSSDLIEAKIRGSNNWSLLESQAYFSTVLPSHYLSGTIGPIRFPGWFGKNSQRNKSLRITGELYSHARTSISGDKFSVRLDYAEPLTRKLLTPLKQKQLDGIDDTLEVMKTYCLLREDLSNLCELMTSFFNNKNNPFDSVNSATKSALTRKYNKTMVLSFAPPTASKKKKATTDLEGISEEEESSGEEDNDNVDADSLVKVKTKTTAKAGTSSKSTETKPKGRGGKAGGSATRKKK